MAESVQERRVRYYIHLEKRRLQGDKLTDRESSVLERAKDADKIERSGPLKELARQFRGDVGRENIKDVGGIATDAAAAYGGELGSRRFTAPRFPGLKGKVINRGAAALSAMLSDRFINQQLIHGKSPEEVSNLQTGLSGAAEAIIPPALHVAGQTGKALYGVGSDVVSGATKKVGDSKIGNFFRQLIGKGDPENPNFAVQAGHEIEDQAARVRSGVRDRSIIEGEGVTAVPEFSKETLKHIDDFKLSTRVATEFNHRLVELFDGITQKSYTGQKPMEALIKSGQQLLESRVMDFVRTFKNNMSPHQLSVYISQAIKGNIEFATSLRKYNFLALDMKAGRVEGFRGVNLSDPVGGKGFYTFREAVDILDGASDKAKSKIVKQIKKATEEVDRAPITEGPHSGFSNDDITAFIRDAKEVEGILVNEEFMKQKLGESASSLAKKAIVFNQRTAKLINDTAILDVAKSTPELLLEQLFKDGRSDTIRAVFNMKKPDGSRLLSENARNGIRAAFLGTIQGQGKFGSAGILTQASRLVTGGVRILDGAALERVLNNAEGRMGRAVGKALFPGSHGGFKSLRKFAKFLQSQQKESGGVGAMSFVLGAPSAAQSLVHIGVATTAGVVTGVATGNDFTTYMTVVGAGTLLFSPKGMASFLANPTTRNALINGIKKNSNQGADHLATYMKSATAQALAKSFGAIFVSDEDKAELTDVSSARIGGAETNF